MRVTRKKNIMTRFRMSAQTGKSVLAAAVFATLAVQGLRSQSGDNKEKKHPIAAAIVNPPVFTQTNLVSDVAGMAKTTDANLVNPWGMTLGLNGGIWIAINGTGKAATYDGAGQAIPSGSPVVVTIPARSGGTGPSSPTGVVTNAT